MPEAKSASSADASQTERHCVACGYNLYGLGEESRCPECGLLNVPEAFRRQVWELVDSGKWFFSGFFSPLKKRPPGWWWSLDRPGDVKLAALRAGLFMGLAVLLITGATALDDAARVNLVQQWGYSRGELDESGLIQWHEYTSTISVGAFGKPEFAMAEYDTRIPQAQVASRGRGGVTNTSTQLFEWRPTFGGIAVGLLLSLWAVLTWLLPAAVGLCTQIRRGIPPFAQAPKTVFAAALHESHRLLYLAVVVVICAALDALIRQNLLGAPNRSLFVLLPALLFLVLVGGYCGTTWVGALRSDYTRQLIRSCFHALRIVVFYVVVLPTLIVFAIGMLTTTERM